MRGRAGECSGRVLQAEGVSLGEDSVSTLVSKLPSEAYILLQKDLVFFLLEKVRWWKKSD